MANLSIERRVPATPEVVFQLYVDIERAPERMNGIARIEKLTEGPIGAGSRWRETRLFRGKEMKAEEMEMTALDPPRGFTIECTSHGTHSTSTFRFEPSGDGTLVHVDLETQPVTIVAKVFAPIAKGLLGTIKRMMEQDFDELEQHLPSAS